MFEHLAFLCICAFVRLSICALEHLAFEHLVGICAFVFGFDFGFDALTLALVCILTTFAFAYAYALFVLPAFLFCNLALSTCSEFSTATAATGYCIDSRS